MGADQQADVVGTQGAAAIGTLLDQPPVEQRGCEAGDLAGELPLQGAAARRFLAGLALPAQPEQLQGVLARGQHQAGVPHPWMHLRHRQATAAQARVHQAIQPADQGFAGAVVVGEVADSAGLACRGPGAQVGGQLAAPEAVDRLLGIAHHHQPVPFRLKRPRQDPPLDRVGVLKFIDQGHRIAVSHRLQQRCAGQLPRVEPLQQLGKAEASALAAATVEFAPAPVAGVQQQGLRRTIQQLGDRLQQGPLRQGRLRALGAAVQAPGQLEEGAGVEVVAQQSPGPALAPCRGAVVAAGGLGGNPGLHQSAAVLGGFGAVGGGGFDALPAPLGGRRAKRRLQGPTAFGPELLKPAPGFRPEGCELGGQGRIGLQLGRQGVELQGRIAIELAQQLLQQLGALDPLLQSRQQVAVQGQHLPLPVVVGHLPHQGVLVVFELQLRG